MLFFICNFIPRMYCSNTFGLSGISATSSQVVSLKFMIYESKHVVCYAKVKFGLALCIRLINDFFLYKTATLVPLSCADSTLSNVALKTFFSRDCKALKSLTVDTIALILYGNS